MPPHRSRLDLRSASSRGGQSGGGGGAGSRRTKRTGKHVYGAPATKSTHSSSPDSEAARIGTAAGGAENADPQLRRRRSERGRRESKRPSLDRPQHAPKSRRANADKAKPSRADASNRSLIDLPRLRLESRPTYADVVSGNVSPSSSSSRQANDSQSAFASNGSSAASSDPRTSNGSSATSSRPPKMMTFDEFKSFRSLHGGRMPPVPPPRSYGSRDLVRDLSGGRDDSMMSFEEFKEMKRLLSTEEEEKKKKTKKGGLRRRSFGKTKTTVAKRYGAPIAPARREATTEDVDVPPPIDEIFLGEASSAGEEKDGTEDDGSEVGAEEVACVREGQGGTDARESVRRSRALSPVPEDGGRVGRAPHASEVAERCEASKDGDAADAAAEAGDEAPDSIEGDEEEPAEVLRESERLLVVTATPSVVKEEEVVEREDSSVFPFFPDGVPLPALPLGMPASVVVPEDWEARAGFGTSDAGNGDGADGEANAQSTDAAIEEKDHEGKTETETETEAEGLDARNSSMWAVCDDVDLDGDDDDDEEDPDTADFVLSTSEEETKDTGCSDGIVVLSSTDEDEGEAIGGSAGEASSATREDASGRDNVDGSVLSAPGVDEGDEPTPDAAGDEAKPIGAEPLDAEADPVHGAEAQKLLRQARAEKSIAIEPVPPSDDPRRPLKGRILLVRIRKKIPGSSAIGKIGRAAKRALFLPFKSKGRAKDERVNNACEDEFEVVSVRGADAASVREALEAASLRGGPLSPSSVSIVSVTSMASGRGFIGATPVRSALPPLFGNLGRDDASLEGEDDGRASDRLPPPPENAPALPIASAASRSSEDDEDAVSYLAELMKRLGSDGGSGEDVILLLTPRGDRIEETESEGIRGVSPIEIVDAVEVEGGYLLTPSEASRADAAGRGIFHRSLRESDECQLLPGTIVDSDNSREEEEDLVFEDDGEEEVWNCDAAFAAGCARSSAAPIVDAEEGGGEMVLTPIKERPDGAAEIFRSSASAAAGADLLPGSVIGSEDDDDDEAKIDNEAGVAIAPIIQAAETFDDETIATDAPNCPAEDLEGEGAAVPQMRPMSASSPAPDAAPAKPVARKVAAAKPAPKSASRTKFAAKSDKPTGSKASPKRPHAGTTRPRPGWASRAKCATKPSRPSRGGGGAGGLVKSRVSDIHQRIEELSSSSSIASSCREERRTSFGSVASSRSSMGRRDCYYRSVPIGISKSYSRDSGDDGDSVVSGIGGGLGWARDSSGDRRERGAAGYARKYVEGTGADPA